MYYNAGNIGAIARIVADLNSVVRYGIMYCCVKPDPEYAPYSILSMLLPLPHQIHYYFYACVVQGQDNFRQACVLLKSMVAS